MRSECKRRTNTKVDRVITLLTCVIAHNLCILFNVIVMIQSFRRRKRISDVAFIVLIAEKYW